MSSNLLDSIDLTLPATYGAYLSPWQLLQGMAGGGRFAGLVNDTRNRRLAQLGQPMTEAQWMARVALLTERLGPVSDSQANLISDAIKLAHTGDGIDGKTLFAMLRAAQVQAALYAREPLGSHLLPHEEWLEAMSDDKGQLSAFGDKKAESLHRMIKVLARGDVEGVKVTQPE